MSEHKYECSALKHHVCSSIFSFLAATSRRPPSSGVDNLTAARGEKHACQPLNLSVCTKMQFFFFFIFSSDATLPSRRPTAPRHAAAAAFTQALLVPPVCFRTPCHGSRRNVKPSATTCHPHPPLMSTAFVFLHSSSHSLWSSPPHPLFHLPFLCIPSAADTCVGLA